MRLVEFTDYKPFELRIIRFDPNGFIRDRSALVLNTKDT